jgi:SAM-dependent methyltransferase
MQIGDLSKTSEGRLFINTKLIPSLLPGLKEGDNVLFVGTDSAWDYKSLFFNPSKLCNFETMDINSNLNPDIVGNIASCPQVESSKYDLILLIGVYEFVNDKPAMFSEINRLLKPNGLAMLSLPGRGFYDSPNNSVEPREVFDAIKPLLAKEVYIIGETKERRPTSIHIVADKQVG